MSGCVWVITTGDYDTEVETIRGVYLDSASAEAAADAYNEVAADPYEADPREAVVTAHAVADGVLPTHRPKLVLQVNVGPDGTEYGFRRKVDPVWTFTRPASHLDDTTFTIDRQQYKGDFRSPTASYSVNLMTHRLVVSGTDHDKVQAAYDARLADIKSRKGAGL